MQPVGRSRFRTPTSAEPLGGMGMAEAASFPPWPVKAGKGLQGEKFTISPLGSASVDLRGLPAAS